MIIAYKRHSWFSLDFFIDRRSLLALSIKLIRNFLLIKILELIKFSIKNCQITFINSFWTAKYIATAKFRARSYCISSVIFWKECISQIVLAFITYKWHSGWTKYFIFWRNCYGILVFINFICSWFVRSVCLL